MLLPKDILSGTYRKPDVYLCETDKSKICKLETMNMQGTFKFNSYSELSFDVARIYNDIITGETCVNPYYNKVEALRLIYLEGFGYFELQDPKTESDGIKETKSLTAYSSEYTMSQKYLELFKVNMGTVDSIEVMYAEEYNGGSIVPITFYNENPKLSLLHLVLDKVYGWKIGHIDPSLKTMSRQFEVDRESVYDFIMNEICDKFNCYAVFDTIKNEINFYAETSVNKFTGDGSTKTFMVYPVFGKPGTVSVDGYKTIDYDYDKITGKLTLGTAPAFGAIVEVTDGSLALWETDVYITFDNLAQQMDISYSADDIKTVLTVKGADDLDIREVNNGLPYIVDLSYFYNVDWMGQDLYDKYTDYLKKCTDNQVTYKDNSQKILELADKISNEKNRLSWKFSRVTVSSETVGTYYVRDGAHPNFNYTEVTLPDDFIAGTTYYSNMTTDLNKEKVSDLYKALQDYYSAGETKDIEVLYDSFSFLDDIPDGINLESMVSALKSNNTDKYKEDVILAVLNKMWDQFGLVPLRELYLAPYKGVQAINASDGWAEKNNENYGRYYPVVLIIESLENAIKTRQETIDKLTYGYKDQDKEIKGLEDYKKDNEDIGNDLLISNPKNFTKEEMIRLSAFLREDEYTDNNFVYTGIESEEDLFKLKQELLECGRIELSKLCEPCLKFSMSLANIYALPEFAPIATQFQLGNLIKVAFRPDYIKHARLMQVNLNFEDFSDFSCEFGDLSSIRSQTDLHADLLGGAVSAGKTVASSASYWNKGSDMATAIDMRVQQGLLNAATEIKSIDATQSVVIDNYGIHLQEIIDQSTGKVSDKQGWIVNNKFLYSDDGFKTTKSVFGEYEIDNETYWGLLAEAVIAGYIEGSTIKGGTIQIGERSDGTYNFEVDKDGYITMTAGKGISSNGKIIELDDESTTIEVTSNSNVLDSDVQNIVLSCRIYSDGVDVTNDYGSSAFHWIRSSGDEAADESWNLEHYNNESNSVLTVTADDLTDIAFFQCQVISTTTKWSNSIAIKADSSDINIFTSKPNSAMEDGYFYHEGDLWILGDDYQPGGYLRNTILICTNERDEYLDSDWVGSTYYSKTFSDIYEWKSDMQQHVQVRPDGLHLIGSETQGATFEAILDSKELAFYASESGQSPVKLVWLGTNDTNIKNLNVQNYLSIQQEKESDALPHIKLGNFAFQVESNGSLSII